MTVQELREMLDGLPDNMLVVLQKDAEGNGYSPLSGVDSVNCVYRAESTFGGKVGYAVLTEELAKAGYDADDVFGDGVLCVVFCPIN